MMISYGGNFEDVLLARAFLDVDTGFYVDIGAGHGKFGNVSYWFYEHGWTGVNVEPGSLFETLPIIRPRDTNVRIAISDHDGDMRFFLHPDNPATSTVEPQLGPQFAGKVRERIEVRVPCITMSTLIERYIGDRHVHFLKVDVEGSEAALFRSCDWRRFRPEVIVSEATRPYTNEPVYGEWDGCLTGASYQFACFDGINAWFVREESAHLLPLLALPVNQLDFFVPYDDEKFRLGHELEALRAEVASLRGALAVAKSATEELNRIRQELRWPNGPRSVQAVLPIAALLRAMHRKRPPPR